MTNLSRESAKQKIIVSIVTLFAIALLVGGGEALSKHKASPTTVQTATAPTSSSSTSSYKDGSYTADGDYSSPGGTQTVSVSLTLAGNVVTAATVKGDAQDGVAQIYQSYFVGGYKQYVVGKKIDSLHLSRVAGSSLTSKGFNDALQKIKQQAS